MWFEVWRSCRRIEESGEDELVSRISCGIVLCRQLIEVGFFYAVFGFRLDLGRQQVDGRENFRNDRQGKFW